MLCCLTVAATAYWSCGGEWRRGGRRRGRVGGNGGAGPNRRLRNGTGDPQDRINVEVVAERHDVGRSVELLTEKTIRCKPIA